MTTDKAVIFYTKTLFNLIDLTILRENQLRQCKEVLYEIAELLLHQLHSVQVTCMLLLNVMLLSQHYIWWLGAVPKSNIDTCTQYTHKHHQMLLQDKTNDF